MKKPNVMYFKTHKEAEDYAIDNGFPSDRIRWFMKGCAIQFYAGGPYVTTDSEENKVNVDKYFFQTTHK